MTDRSERSGERGTALIVALLVMVIMTLLGIPFLLMGETENRIAENERLSLQALYAAESGARVVKRWFDHPAASTNVVNPPLAAIHRAARMIDDDGDPGTAPVAADGSVEHPYYKQTGDGVFDKPYRGSLEDALLGTEDNPDMRIDAADSSAAADFLEQLSKSLFADLPSAVRKVEIRRIDIYAPPVLQTGSDWTRYGVGTVKVTAGVYQEQPDGSEHTLAERVVRMVFNEIPYNNQNLGALHTCDDLAFPNEMKAHWGLITAKDDIELEEDHTRTPASLPRAPVRPSSLKIDMLWAGTDPSHFGLYRDAIEGFPIDDPWIHAVAGEDLDQTGSHATDLQPWPFDWDPTQPLGDGHWPNHGSGDPPSHLGSLSYIYQFAVIGCPEYPYERWKEIAQSGGPNVRYFSWDSYQGEDWYKENGTGTARRFRDITDNQSGLFFFDTRDGLPPNGANLTPDIYIAGGVWSFRGLLILNSDEVKLEGVTGRTIDFVPPGEPFLDLSEDGIYQPGEPFINLRYPTTLGDPFIADADDLYGATGPDPVRNSRGKPLQGEAHVWGILYNEGYLDSTGNLVVYGSATGVDSLDSGSSAPGVPEFYYDQTLAENGWPPPELGLPRVMVTRWETGL